MKTLAAPPHEEAGGSVAAFIPRKPSGYQALVLGKKTPRDFELRVSTLRSLPE